MARHKNSNWDPEESGAHTWANVPIYLLMDIRDELQVLNRLLACPNFTRLPQTMKLIEKNTRRKKRVQPKAPLKA